MPTTLGFLVQFKGSYKGYKSFLKRLKRFGELTASVGIHAVDGKRKIIRRYFTLSPTTGKMAGHTAGKSHRMTLSKLAYQNEFGATIPIKTKYRHRTTKKDGATITRSYKAKKQGYMFYDMTGKCIGYKKPGSVIVIPERSFLRKTVKNVDIRTYMAISKLLKQSLEQRRIAPKEAMAKIAMRIQRDVRENIKNSKPNNALTIRIKGRNRPLRDDSDRIYKYIKYKVYSKNKMAHKALLSSQFVKLVDEELKTIKVFENITKIQR